jgi:hypothetical protein
LGKTNAL